MFRQLIDRWTLALVLIVTAAQGATAAETPLPAQASDAQIAQWIDNLDATLFAQRSEASRNLQAAGKAAIPALAEAALGESRETRMRAFEILRKHFEDGDAGTKEAAKSALEKIAASGHEGSAARADEILNPKEQAPVGGMPRFAIPAQVQIRVNAIGGGQRIQINNGVKQIETDDGQRKIRITEDPAKGIEVEITEKKDGQATTEKFQAKNADELKKNHPEAHKLYEKMGQQLRGIRVGVQAGPGAVQPDALRAETVRRGALAALEASRRMLEGSLRQLGTEPLPGEDAEQYQRTIKRLKEIAKELEEEEDRLAPPK